MAGSKLQKQHDKMSSADNKKKRPKKRSCQPNSCTNAMSLQQHRQKTPLGIPVPVNRPRMRHVSAASSSPFTDFLALLTSPGKNAIK